MKDNEYIRNGYRINYTNVVHALKSLVQFHNESINMWSHMICSLVCLMIIFVLYWSYLGRGKDWEIFSNVGTWPLYAFLFSAIFCLCCSFAFHCFNCLNKTAHDWLNRLDYSGIAILIIGSCYPPFYYVFYSKLEFVYIYLSIITFIGISCFIVSMLPKFNHNKYRVCRAAMFITFGLSIGFLGIIHIVFIGVDINPDKSVWFYISMGFFYVLGGSVYGMRMPER